MATSEGFATFVLEQLGGVEGIWARKMFGEYAVYAGEKVVAFLVDNQLFVKPTDAGRAFLVTPSEEIPFPGARPMFLVADELDDPERLCELVRRTSEALPPPKPKRPKKPRERKPAR